MRDVARLDGAEAARNAAFVAFLDAVRRGDEPFGRTGPHTPDPPMTLQECREAEEALMAQVRARKAGEVACHGNR